MSRYDNIHDDQAFLKKTNEKFTKLMTFNMEESLQKTQLMINRHLDIQKGNKVKPKKNVTFGSTDQ